MPAFSVPPGLAAAVEGCAPEVGAALVAAAGAVGFGALAAAVAGCVAAAGWVGAAGLAGGDGGAVEGAGAAGPHAARTEMAAAEPRSRSAMRRWITRSPARDIRISTGPI